MEINYGSKGVYNYIDVKINQKEDDALKESFRLSMLENNSIFGIVCPVIGRMDDDIYLKYPVNSMFVLDKYLIKLKPDINLLVKFLKNICGCIDELEKYLLKPDDLVISPEYMLWDNKLNNIKLIYAPGYDRDIKSQLKSFMEYIMQTFDYKSANGTMEMHRLYEMISKDEFDIKELEDSLNNNRFTYKNNISVSEYNNIIIPEYNQGTDLSSDDIYTKLDETKVILNKSINHEILIAANTFIAVIFFLGYLFFNKHKVLLLFFAISIIILVINTLIYIFKKEKEEEIDAEQSMKEFKEHMNKQSDDFICTSNNFSRKETYSDKEAISQKKEFKLVPLNDGLLEPIVLNCYTREITVGRAYKEVDYRLNKEQISRIHASIVLNEEGMSIEDKNSTNGTYINSERLEAFVPKSLSIGDIVRFANEEFFVA